MMTFESLHIIKPITEALKSEGYLTPTPIQTAAIPVLLAGKDLLGSAQTGTGKTAAFAIPILQKLYTPTASPRRHRSIKALILTPTRELAAQIKESFINYGQNLGIKTVVIFGGVPQKSQTDAIKAGLDVLIATPGRLLDLMNQGFIDLKSIEYFVLDEADRMLDMGFIHDVKKIIQAIPTQRQTMLFSATMPKAIADLANSILIDPVRIAIDPVETTVEAINQKMYFVLKKNKTNLLIHLLKNPKIESVLVFSRTKHGANKIVKDLGLSGIYAEAIHGNKSQGARTQALAKFKNRELRVLVATDIAARGLDIEKLSHVINYDLPEVPETYIHRIGRTGRAGLAGDSISFCGEEEEGLLKDIERHIGIKIPVIIDHPYHGIFAKKDARAAGKTVTQKPQPSTQQLAQLQKNREAQKQYNRPKQPYHNIKNK
jgi:ATP-dependent RNA helicase RhlE